ncbi:hypothetical protein BP6252_02848 [Coleophoma cylindrospora]|uniref:Uncharacterized protein n=1 Tax=Coleophoma cylindrospora TaxID=1849047 RepID=A0A3D8SHM1_9HELO|nr:hypothetical protein BP6252_02848 [Coleophoma cylindrospora]
MAQSQPDPATVVAPSAAVTAAPASPTPPPNSQALPTPLPSGHETLEIDHDEHDDDVDSALGDDQLTLSTASLASSIRNYTYENGRRYHAYRSGEYILPNDEKEQERMDLKHHIFTLILGGRSFVAPVGPNPQRILDVGTGTGIWAMEVADAYPGADVLGTDLSPIQPAWVPPNLSFVIDDAESEWSYSPNKLFDLIHWRMLFTAIKDWPRLYEQAYKNLKPGGWLEVHEHESDINSDDDSVLKAQDLKDWFKLVAEACAKFGKDSNIAHKQKQWMIDAGFVDVQEDVYKVPIGRWPKDKLQKEIGLYFQVQTLDGLEPVSMALFTRVLGLSKEQVDVMLVGPRKAVKNPECHLYLRFYVVRGRKPESD